MSNSPLTLKEWYRNGHRLMAEERYQEAIEAYSRAIVLNVEYAEAYFKRAACYYRLGSYQKAADDLKAAALLGCEDAIFWTH